MTTPLLTQALLTAFETALNGYLRLDPDTLSHLAELNGRVIAVEFTGVDRTLYLLPGLHGVRLRDTHPLPPDAVLRGSPPALLRLGLQRADKGAAQATLFSGAVEISGDVELGQRFKQLLDGMDIDWEEWLSKFTGDVLAHRIGTAARATQTWATRNLETFGQNFAEYQQEERRTLPAAAEAQALYRDVDELRDAVERLEQRIQRLQAGSNRAAAPGEKSAGEQGNTPASAPEPND